MDSSLAQLLPVVVALLGGLCTLLSVAVVAGLGLWWLKRSGGLGALGASLGGGAVGGIDVDGLSRMYTERLGYRSVDTGDPERTHMVREVDGVEVHLTSRTRAGGLSTAVEYQWSSPRSADLQVQVVELSVADPRRRAARNAAMNRSHDFTPRWSTHFPTGDPALDARFRVFAPTADHAASVGRHAAALLACAHVELTAGPEGIVLSDAFQDGLLARMGGPMGMARVATPAGIAVQVALHEEAAAVICGLVGGAR